jgi:tRNA dimethylallyltransferase
MQVYRELRILTARPTPQDETRVPHKLYGVLQASEICSAARWLTLARIAIDEAWQAGKFPIITGGTGLYIKALMDGLSPIPEIPPEMRKQATVLWETQGARALKERDPEMATRLKDADQQRHVRALEVLLATGTSLAHWQSLPRIKAYPDATFDVEYVDVPRDILYARCNARFLAMMHAGALEEAKQLQALKLSDDYPAMRAVGVRELCKHLQGKLSLDEAIQAAQQATRNYAKRQVTWFKNQLKQS